MEFKIDTKDSFCTITPVFKEWNANLAGALQQKLEELRQSGSKNFIIDLQYCEEADTLGLEQLKAIHEDCYGMDQSIVYTGINGTIMAALKNGETDLLINIAPKMEEAIDIISMEILERDLLSEE